MTKPVKKLPAPNKRFGILRRTLGISWRSHPAAILLFGVGALLETGSFVGTLYASAQLSGRLAAFASGQTVTDVWLWLWLDILCAAGIALGFWLMSWAKRMLYFQMVGWCTSQYQQALCRIDIPDFYTETVRNGINKASSGYNWQIPNLGETILELLYGIFRFVVTALIVIKIAWWLIPLVGIFLIPSLFVERRLATVLWFVWDEEGDNRQTFWSLDWLLRQAKNQMELRSSQARPAILSRLSEMTISFYAKQLRGSNAAYQWMGPARLVEVSSTAIGAVVLLRQFLSTTINLEQYFFLSGALLRISGSLNNIFGTLGRLQEPALFAQTFFELIDWPSHLADKPNALKLSSEGAPEIVFDNVSFSYPKQATPVFENLSLTIKPGEHIALVGENGAGKSTLIKLLLRFYIPTSGRIMVDGHDLQDIAIESWYARLATLFQDFNQYPLSIRENVEIGRPEAGDDTARLNKAATDSNIAELISGYKHGWETVLDNSFEKGVEPSGGQWQRVALARVFYRDAPVLILDEPTSAIDAQAEYDIFNSIFEHYAKRTTIIVSHRFSTVRRAHRILVVDGGAIVEQGTHAELMKLRGRYHDMFTKQAEGYR